MTSFTDDENTRRCWLRAVEWVAWPAFLSQPLLPILYVYYPWWKVLLAVIIASLLWTAVRYRFTSFALATAGFFFVQLKWITIPVGAFVLFRQHRFLPGALAVVTPFLAAWLGFAGKIGVIQNRFMNQLGYPRRNPS